MRSVTYSMRPIQEHSAGGRAPREPDNTPFDVLPVFANLRVGSSGSSEP
jgi:hypothetical protein